MSDLLIILVVLGAIIVVSVVVFNWWQEKKFQNRISSDFKPTKRDALFEDYQTNTDFLAKQRGQNNALKERQEPSQAPIKKGTHDGRRIEPSLSDDAFNSIIDENEKTLFKEPQFDEPQFQASQFEDETALDDDLPSTKFDVEIDEVYEDYNDAAIVSSNITIKEEQQVIEAIEQKVAAPKQDDVLLPATLHNQVDLIALLYASTPITHAGIVNTLKQFKEFPERTFIFGLTAANDWVEVNQSDPDTAFTQLAYSLQLADRGGAVTRPTLNRFQHMVETIGLDMSAHVEWQGSGDPLNNANMLDQFCIEVDKTVGFHLMVTDGSTFHATKLRGLAEAQGLSLGNDGRFHMFDSSAPDQLKFSLKNYDDNPFSVEMLKSAVMHGVTFQLDIPTVKNSADVFDDMIIIARAMARSLDAVIVDDLRKPLGEIHLEKIRQQLKKINAQMIAKGIIPGSTQALRLFS
ncbi:MAG: cell division protein ZipA C-terminal FtsZ-binding domain-containing protein [Methylophilus sp.]